jgi:hypothetical protein
MVEPVVPPSVPVTVLPPLPEVPPSVPETELPDDNPEEVSEPVTSDALATETPVAASATSIVALSIMFLMVCVMREDDKD